MRTNIFKNKYLLIIMVTLSLISSTGILYFFSTRAAVDELVPVPSTWDKGDTSSNQQVLEVILNGKMKSEQLEFKISSTRVIESSSPSKTSVEDPNKAYQLEVSDKAGKNLSTLTFVPTLPVAEPPAEPGKPRIKESKLRETFTEGFNIAWVEGAASITLKKAGKELDKKPLNQVQKIRNKNQLQFEKIDGTKLEKKSKLTNFFQKPTYAHNSKLHIAIIGDDYTSTSLSKFDSDVAKIVTGFQSFQPYQGRISQISFGKIKNTRDLGCYYSGRLIYCDDGKITQYVNESGVPYDKIMVIVNNSNYGGSGGPIAKTYAGSYTGPVAIHEFTHSFAKVSDEYNYSDKLETFTNSIYEWHGYGYACYAGYAPYTTWSGLVANQDYARGCIYPNYYRSSGNSLMYSITSRYFGTPIQKRINSAINHIAGEYVNTSTPTVNTSLKTGAVISGNYPINITVTDPQGISRVEYLIDGKLYKTMYNTYNYTLPTRNFPNGNHAITIRAFDGADKATIKYLTVTVKN